MASCKNQPSASLAITGVLIAGLSTAASGVNFAGGTGEPNDPYQIATAEQLTSIGSDPNLLDKHYILIVDIDLDPNLPGGRVFDDAVIAPWLPQRAMWNPNRPLFNGTFDGNDHAIQNLTINGTPPQGILGLFGGVLRDAWIGNLRLENVHVRGSTCVGGLVGSCAGTIVACRVTGSVYGSEHSDHVGLLAAWCYGSVQDCVVGGVTSGGMNVGGLIGFSEAVVTRCESRGQVDGQYCVGGLIGHNDDRGQVVMCSSRATVVGTGDIGGLVGYNRGLVVYSYVDASVSASSNVGGLVGENRYGVMAYCYALGDVFGRVNVGGLVGVLGSNSRMEECYMAGRPAGGEYYVGGLIGTKTWSTGTVVLRCFWDTDASGCTSVFGGLGRTTAQMHDPNTFIDAGWDFPGTPGGPLDKWVMPQEGGYPVLAWQLSPWSPLPVFAGGTGTASDPFLISTAEQLRSIANDPLLINSHFALIDDIALTGEVFWPIGSQRFPFAGTFDGRGRTITGLVIRRDAGDNVGLFAVVDGRAAQIRNIVLAGPHIEAPASENVGALAGYVHAGCFAQCAVTDANVIGDVKVGGFIGWNDGIVSDCHVDGVVAANRYVGGLVGYNRNTVERCAAICMTSGDFMTGGLVGCHLGQVVDSYSEGVTSGNDWVGGLAGGGDVPARVERCFSSGTVTGTRRVGGLMGQSCGTVASCYARADVHGQSQVGGLVGDAFRLTVIRRCYCAGSVAGEFDFGAIIGSMDEAADIVSCLWNATAAGTLDAVGNLEPDPEAVFGKPTADLQNAATFTDAGWDFENVWMICEGQDYPRLQWEGVECR